MAEGSRFSPPRRPNRWLAPLLVLVMAAALLLPRALMPVGAQSSGGAATSPSASAAQRRAFAGSNQPPLMQPLPSRRRDAYQRLEPLPAALRQAPAIRIGVHLENAYNLSVPDQTFMADGWYWLEWPEAVQTMMEAEEIESDQLVEVVNNIIGYDFNVEADNKEPMQRPDGSRYQLFRFSGSFYIDDLNLRDSPFNQLSLPLIFETRPPSFAIDGETPVLLIPSDDREGLMGAYATIRGYRELGANIQALVHTYPTDFGDRSTRSFAMTEMRVYYRTPWFTAFLQWVVPLLIVMAVVFLAPSLEGSLGELRLAIPSTALLTLVVMQQTYQAELPPLPYLTFLDKLYVYCYLVSIGLFILFVWGTNRMAAAEREGGEGAVLAVRQGMDRADLVFQVVSLAGLVLVALLGWWF